MRRFAVGSRSKIISSIPAQKTSERLDAKARALLDWLKTLVRPNGMWSKTRVIVFTEYRATQNWLYEHLAAHGFSEHGRLVTLHGMKNNAN